MCTRVYVSKSFMFLGEIRGLIPGKACSELPCSVALRKRTVLHVKLQTAPKQHTLLIQHEIEQLDHQGCHLACCFHVMKFARKKSRIQKEKTGCCGRGGKRLSSNYMLIPAEQATEVVIRQRHCLWPSHLQLPTWMFTPHQGHHSARQDAAPELAASFLTAL